MTLTRAAYSLASLLAREWSLAIEVETLARFRNDSPSGFRGQHHRKRPWVVLLLLICVVVQIICIYLSYYKSPPSSVGTVPRRPNFGSDKLCTAPDASQPTPFHWQQSAASPQPWFRINVDVELVPDSLAPARKSNRRSSSEHEEEDACST